LVRQLARRLQPAADVGRRRHLAAVFIALMAQADADENLD
jgi:hypothetical protein